MKNIVILILILISYNLHAQVNFTPTKQLLISGKSCDDIIPHAQAILDWSQLISPSLSLKMPACYCAADQCQMDLFPISPYYVQKYTNFGGPYSRVTAYKGPNCFNAALLISRSLPNPTFSHPAELSHILSSPLCQERTLNEPLQAGDLLVVRDQRVAELEVHAGTYISDDLSFSKYGESYMMAYSLGVDVIRAYGVKKEECRRVQGIPAKGSPCYREPFANYFNCQPLYRFVSHLSNLPGGLNEKLRELYAAVSRLDMSISKIAMEGQPVTEKELTNGQKSMRKLYKSAKRIVQIESLTSDEKSFALMMKYRLLSLFEQSRRIAHSKGLKKLVEVSLD